jgi:hypothetical protein
MAERYVNFDLCRRQGGLPFRYGLLHHLLNLVLKLRILFLVFGEIFS